MSSVDVETLTHAHLGPISALTKFKRGFIAGTETGQIWISARRTEIIHQPHPITCLFALSNREFISGSSDGNIISWDVSRRKFRTYPGYLGPVYAVAGRSNRWIAAGCKYGLVYRDLRKKQIQILVKDTPVRAVNVINRRLISGHTNGQILIWSADCATCTVVGQDPAPISAIKINYDIICTVNYTGVCIRNAKTQICSQIPVYAVDIAIVSNSCIIIGATDGAIHVWTSQQMSKLVEHTQEVTGLDVLADNTIISGSRDASIRIWRL